MSTPRLCLRLLEWIDDRQDAKRDAYSGGTGKRWRWWLIRQVDRLPGQCWADLVDFGLDRSIYPWAPRLAICAQDAQNCGTCYCGKVARDDVPLWPEGPRARVIVPRVKPADGAA